MSTTNSQSGFVSLFTVIFFMMLVTVITIGFLRIMGLEQQQALDNDLSASAVAAAESGIEDGKRALIAYETTTDPTLKAALASAFTSTNCDALTGSAAIRGALGLNVGGNVIGNPQLNQYYTCLTIALNTPNFAGDRSAGVSDYIPLSSTNPSGPTRVKVSWHLISETVNADGDGIPADYANDRYLQPLNNVTGTPSESWSNKGYPAYLRVQVYGHPNNVPFTRGDIDTRTHTLLLVPTRDTNPSAADENTPLNMATLDPRGFDQPRVPQQIKCKPSPATQIGSYACAATLELTNNPAFLGPNNSYFLRITPFYSRTHYTVAMQDGSGNPLQFNAVQPIIDSTGRSADVYRRLQARVRVNPPANLPEFVAESATTICKNMQISNASLYAPNNCP